MDYVCRCPTSVAMYRARRRGGERGSLTNTTAPVNEKKISALAKLIAAVAKLIDALRDAGVI